MVYFGVSCSPESFKSFNSSSLSLYFFTLKKSQTQGKFFFSLSSSFFKAIIYSKRIGFSNFGGGGMVESTNRAPKFKITSPRTKESYLFVPIMAKSPKIRIDRSRGWLGFNLPVLVLDVASIHTSQGRETLQESYKSRKGKDTGESDAACYSPCSSIALTLVVHALGTNLDRGKEIGEGMLYTRWISHHRFRRGKRNRGRV